MTVPVLASRSLQPMRHALAALPLRESGRLRCSHRPYVSLLFLQPLRF